MYIPRQPIVGDDEEAGVEQIAPNVASSDPSAGAQSPNKRSKKDHHPTTTHEGSATKEIIDLTLICE
jgi:hypothetical protein